MDDPAQALQLSGVALLGITLLIVLIVRQRLPPFVALLLVSLLIGLGAQWPRSNPAGVLRAMQTGMGDTLGFVAIVVGLGAMLGALLERSGAALGLANAFLARFGVRRAAWGLGLAGFLVSIPVFFDVAFVVLVPLLYGLARRSGRPVLLFAVPLLAGLVVTHAFVPPTPGPTGVASILGADLGVVIGLGLVAGLPAMVVVGVWMAPWLAARVRSEAAPVRAETATEPRSAAVKSAEAGAPSVGTSLALIGLPLLLIVGNTAGAALWGEGDEGMASVLRLVGHPFVALLVTTLLGFWWLGTRRGMTRDEVAEVATRALEPAGIIILVTGAGGVLKQVLIDTEVGKLLATQLAELGIPPLVLAFCIAWVVRVMQGSATVAMLTAAGLVVPLVDAAELTASLRGLMVVSIAAGATATSHVNDSGFWLVSRYLGLGVAEALRTWTVLTTLVGLVGLAMALLLQLVLT